MNKMNEQIEAINLVNRNNKKKNVPRVVVSPFQ